jgi:hypothetical protein
VIPCTRIQKRLRSRHSYLGLVAYVCVPYGSVLEMPMDPHFSHTSKLAINELGTESHTYNPSYVGRGQEVIAQVRPPVPKTL